MSDALIDEITNHLRSAEQGIVTLMGQHMGDCSKRGRKNMRKANRLLLRAHCELADARDECFPDYEPGPEVQSGGT